MIIIHLLFSPLEKQKSWTSNSLQAHENKEVQEEDELIPIYGLWALFIILNCYRQLLPMMYELMNQGEFEVDKLL
jgi:hypothetical protein